MHVLQMTLKDTESKESRPYKNKQLKSHLKITEKQQDKQLQTEYNKQN